jgi:hypothetical protein
MAELLKIPGIEETFVVGLSWWHETATPKAKDLRARSRNLDARWGVVRDSGNGAIQSGFCAPVDGVKSPASVHPLAALIADAHAEPWRGVFRIGENRYWYIAVRDGHGVLQDGDQIGTLEQLKRVQTRHDELPGWTDYYDKALPDLANLLRSTRKFPALRDLQQSPWRKVAIVSAVTCTVVVGGVGTWLWHERQVEIETQAQAARQRAVVAALAAKRLAESAIRPWTQQPMPSEVSSICAGVWHVQDLLRKGWTLTAWSCTANEHGVEIEGSWSISGGLAKDAPGVLSPDGITSNTSGEVATAFSAPSDSALTTQDAIRAVWDFAQQRGLGLSLKAPTQTAVLPGTDASTHIDSAWSTETADFTTAYPPWLAPKTNFDTVAGLRIVAISYDAVKEQWKASGTLYGLRESTAAKPERTLPASARVVEGEGVNHGHS